MYWNYEKSVDFQALRWKIAYLCVTTSTRRRVKWNRLVNIIDINHKYGVIALLDTQYNVYVSISESGEILVMLMSNTCWLLQNHTPIDIFDCIPNKQFSIVG